MTSASELFSVRRFRPVRNPEPPLRSRSAEVDRDRDRDRDRPPRRQYRHHLHHHDCSSPRHLSHGGPLHLGRHPCDRVSPTDFNGTIESSLRNNSNSEIPGRNNRLRLTTNERLPGAVLQARARLLERLRGISLTGSRQNAANSGISWDEFAVSDDFRVTDSVNRETGIPLEGLESGSLFSDLTSRAEQSPSIPHQEKPPGLTREAINTLQREIFEDLEDTSGMLKASLECCICLDKFCEGDSLMRLTCGHRFHPGCLDPWVRICGDCPYCRSKIVIDPGVEKKLGGPNDVC